MKSAYLYLNFICNNNCIFCASDKTNLNKDKIEFTLREAIQFMDEALLRGYKTLLINGGEPTIHKDILNIIKEGANRFENVLIASNGIKLSNFDFALKLVQSGINGIGIPLYSANSEKFNYLVKNKNAFVNVIKGISNLFELKNNLDFDIMLKILVMKPNYKENPDIVRMIKDEFPEPHSISISGLRVGEKAFKRKEELFVPYNIARSYTTETVKLIQPYKFSFDFLPLCALEDNFVKHLIASKLLNNKYRSYNLKRPDGGKSEGPQPYHYEECCFNCDVFELCTKVHKKNAQFLSYGMQLKSIKLN